MKRTIVAVSLAVIFTLALATPAFGSMEHEATYKWEGTIDFSQQAGHLCNTGAEMQQRITGQGAMEKAKNVYMEEGLITVEDSNDWVTAPDAIRNLTVTSAIMLCAPAKTVYEDEPYNSDFYGYYDDLEDDSGKDYATDAISDQVWAVQVSADPGYSGQIDMAFEAAYSPWVYEDDSDADMEPWRSAWFEGDVYEAWPGFEQQDMGPWFAGNYFNIEQFSRTSQGTHRRHIDISSPWSHAYLTETMTVTGMSEVWEAFSMDNLTAGDEVGQLWWELF